MHAMTNSEICMCDLLIDVLIWWYASDDNW